MTKNGNYSTPSAETGAMCPLHCEEQPLCSSGIEREGSKGGGGIPKCRPSYDRRVRKERMGQDRKQQRPNGQARKCPPQGEMFANVPCVCVHVCMYAREGVRECESVSASVRVCICVCVCGCVCVWMWVWKCVSGMYVYTHTHTSTNEAHNKTSEILRFIGANKPRHAPETAIL